MSARRWLYACPILAVVGAGVLLLVAGSGMGRSPWPGPALRALTHLSPLPGRIAPGFALTDQRGRRITLASLRGRVLVIEPMDPQCTNLCPLISQEFIYAARALGASNSRVTFIGLNVNQFHARSADVLGFSRSHYLERLDNWEFLTASTARLRVLWRSYTIAVQPNRTGDVIHSALMYFIDAQGRERWLAFPSQNPAAVPEWGRAIAAVAQRLLTSAS